MDRIWFDSLNKPFLNPPDAIFMPVWIILYVLIIISFIFFIRSNKNISKKIPMIFFFIQLALNISWHPVFFHFQNIGAALIILTLLWISILLTIITFIRHSLLASALLLPYLFWVSFAFYLNFAYFVLN